MPDHRIGSKNAFLKLRKKIQQIFKFEIHDFYLRVSIIESIIRIVRMYESHQDSYKLGFCNKSP